MILDFGTHVIQHTDDVCWTVCERSKTGERSNTPGKDVLRPCGHYGTFEDAVMGLVREKGDSFDGTDPTLYVAQLAAIWRDVKRTVRAVGKAES